MGAWDPAEALHVRRALFAAPMREDPSPHLFVENVLSPSAYAEMLRYFPPDTALRTWDGHGASGNYALRQEIDPVREANRLTPEERAYWEGAAAFLTGAPFGAMLFERFTDYARQRFGDRIDEPSFLAEAVHTSLLLNRHEPEYFLGPHTDRGDRIFTALFYFPESEGLEHLGTTLYRPLEPGFTSNGATHHDPARFEAREVVPYRANAMLVLAKTDVLFHGVHRLTAQELRGSRRRSMQVHFFLHNRRPRAWCMTSLSAAVAPAMRAGEEAAIAIRLTNRAPADLDSDFPYRTQLGYRWLDADGRVVNPDGGARTPLPSRLASGETAAGAIRVVAPTAPGRYVLRLSVVQEGVAWFDDIDPDNGAEAAVAVAGAAEPDDAADVMARRDDVALGEHWYPPERDGSATFRWAENDAVVHVAALHPERYVLRIVVEPGPGVGEGPLLLRARLPDGREIGTARVPARQSVAFELPPERPWVYSVTLHAADGGRGSADDPRVLNFRVFSITVDRTADVFPPWALPAAGFYPPERSGGDLFRWVGNDALVQLHPGAGRVLEFDAESGPGMSSRPFRLYVRAPDGSELTSAEVGSRTRVAVPLPSGGVSSLQLHADGGGAPVDGDPRVLNFRVFPAKR